MKDFFNFSNSNGGIKAVLFGWFLIGIGMLIWEFIGLDSGSGGTPFNLFE